MLFPAREKKRAHALSFAASCMHSQEGYVILWVFSLPDEATHLQIQPAERKLSQHLKFPRERKRGGERKKETRRVFVRAHAPSFPLFLSDEISYPYVISIYTYISTHVCVGVSPEYEI